MELGAVVKMLSFGLLAFLIKLKLWLAVVGPWPVGPLVLLNSKEGFCAIAQVLIKNELRIKICFFMLYED